MDRQRNWDTSRVRLSNGVHLLKYSKCRTFLSINVSTVAVVMQYLENVRLITI